MSNGISYYHFFVAKGLTEEVAICLKNNCNVNLLTKENDLEVENSSALHLAVKVKNLEIIELLVN